MKENICIGKLITSYPFNKNLVKYYNAKKLITNYPINKIFIKN